jgi:hypothetical protein
LRCDHQLEPGRSILYLPSGYLCHSHGKSPFLIGKPSINGPFSIAMLVSQRDTLWVSPIFGRLRGHRSSHQAQDPPAVCRCHTQ